MYLKVAGVTYENRQEIIKKELNIGSAVKLIREQDNKFDRFAVKIETLKGKQIGYVPKEKSEFVSRILDKKHTLTGKVSSIRGFSNGENVGVGVDIDYRRPESCYTTYTSEQIDYKGLKYKVIDKNNCTEDYAVSLLGFTYTNDTKILEIASYFKTMKEKIFKRNDMPHFIRNISKQAFLNNNSLEKINVTDVVYGISDEAFMGALNLKSVVSLSGFIDDKAFMNCSNLVSVDISPSRIGNSAFKNCIKLDSIKITEIRFKSGSYKSYINGGVEFIGESAFEGCSNIKTIDFSETLIAAVSKRTFANCTSLKEITLPYTLNVIESEAFLNCTSLEKIIIKGDIFRIDKDAFMNCQNLKSIVFEDNVKTISEYSFHKCESLVEIKFKKHLYEIKENAFEGCSNLKQIQIDVRKEWIDMNMIYPKSLKVEFKPIKVRVITDPDEALRLMEEMNEAMIESWIDKYS